MSKWQRVVILLYLVPLALLVLCFVAAFVFPAAVPYLSIALFLCMLAAQIISRTKLREEMGRPDEKE
ncbi:hypothetical protein [Zongyangia hominis]|uniref:Uncharacterized protein n=1 Tax=Zongyangia hominis TaxID=2763677 RepID=A0A926EF49_9FIRM|nr:hypothetical protein [Zongyangia hominis]MBC8570936.1 hypothetical protein [Zongyangia hominis]